MTNGVVSISIVFVCSRSQSHHANTASTPATKVCDHYKTAYLSIEWRIRCLWCNCNHEIIIKKSKNSSKLLLWMPLLLINEYFCAYFVLFHHYMLIQQVLELFFEGNAITMDILKSATDSLTLPCTGSFLKRFLHLIVSTKMAANNERQHLNAQNLVQTREIDVRNDLQIFAALFITKRELFKII